MEGFSQVSVTSLEVWHRKNAKGAMFYCLICRIRHWDSILDRYLNIL